DGPDAAAARDAAAALEKLAEGAPPARQTQAARAARARLARPAPKEPAEVAPPAPTKPGPAPAKMLTRLGKLPFELGQMVSCVCFSPDGKSLALAVPGDSVRLWDPATGKEVNLWRAPVHAATCLAFAPDGKTLVAGGDKGVLRWDVDAGKELP